MFKCPPEVTFLKLLGPSIWEQWTTSPQMVLGQSQKSPYFAHKFINHRAMPLVWTVQFLQYSWCTIFCCPGAVDKCIVWTRGRYNNSSSGENCGQTQTQKLSSTWKKLVSALALRFSCKQLLMLAGEENIRPCTGHLILEYTILALHCPAPEILNE